MRGKIILFWPASLALAGVLVMAAFIIYALILGDFRAEGRVLISMPWGQLSLADVYTGFMLFSIWIYWREASRLRAVIWIVAIMLLGNLISSLYLLVAVYQAKGDVYRLLLGHQLQGDAREMHR